MRREVELAGEVLLRADPDDLGDRDRRRLGEGGPVELIVEHGGLEAGRAERGSTPRSRMP